MDRRTARCGTSILIAGWASVAFSAPARAQPAQLPVDLTWRAPAECPTREWVLAEIERLLSASHNPRRPTTATVAVDREESARWRGTLSLDARDAHTERTLEAESCDAVASAAALVLAIAVEGGVPPPVATATATAPAPATATASATATAPAPATATAPATAPTPPRSQLVLALAALLDDGTMPSPALGGELAIGWTHARPSVRFRAFGAASLYESKPATSQTPSSQTEGGTFTLVTASARGCAGLVFGAFDVGPCFGAEAGFMDATPRGPPPTVASGGVTFRGQPGRGSWGSIVGGVLASWSPFRAFALFVRADGLVTLAQPSFVIDNPAPPRTLVYSLSPLAGRGLLGLEVRFF